MSLKGKVALVTGASRGIGKGIALQLGEAGATVYITGRPASESSGASAPGSLQETAEEIKSRGGKPVAVACDHKKDDDVEKVFQQIVKEQGRLDILVNNAYSAIPALLENFGKPFWEIPEKIWDDINAVGLRNNYICSVKAAKIMVKQGSGLIVNVSSGGGKVYLFTPAYGIGKAAKDRMAADCALELKSHNVAYVSLWPGPVQTELIQQSNEDRKSDGPVPTGETAHLGANAYVHEAFTQGESIEFAGKCIVALASDKKILEKSGKILETFQIAKEFNLVDIDGRKIESVAEQRAKQQST